MNSKRLFMHELQKELRWKCKASEFKDIIVDYEDFFQNGLGHGKSEDELCQEFGKPKEIVEKMYKEDGITKLSSQCSNRLIQKILLVLAMMPIVGFYLVSGKNPSHTAWYYILFVIGMPVVLWYTLGGNYLIYGAPESQKRRISCFVLHGLFVVLLISFCILNVYGISYLLEEYPFGPAPQTIGTFVQYVYYTMAFATATLVLIGMYFFYNGRCYFFTVICHGVGLFSSILLWGREVKYMGILGNADILLAFTPYIIGVCIATAAGFYTGRLKREY